MIVIKWHWHTLLCYILFETVKYLWFILYLLRSGILPLINLYSWLKLKKILITWNFQWLYRSRAFLYLLFYILTIRFVTLETIFVAHLCVGFKAQVSLFKWIVKHFSWVSYMDEYFLFIPNIDRFSVWYPIYWVALVHWFTCFCWLIDTSNP